VRDAADHMSPGAGPAAERVVSGEAAGKVPAGGE
jgi:hypothetical protein